MEMKVTQVHAGLVMELDGENGGRGDGERDSGGDGDGGQHGGSLSRQSCVALGGSCAP